MAAHIHAASEGGPRFNSSQTSDERSSASNGIWLCEFCASLVDKNHGVDFSPELLKQWKEIHELRTFVELTTGASEAGLTGWCEEFEGNWKLFVKNPTIVPFYDCVVRGFKQENFDADFGDVEVVFGTIPPRQSLDDTIEYGILSSDIFGYPLIDLEYTDVEGVHWLRHSSGKLAKIDFRRPFD
ncbi:hypothetical protein [Roseibacillus persicicus]|uniref:hypothetical protein n=1 Tax=Roseibacillus persicicus TaxID=454148 RepID=UPI00167C0B60|nr:hypothetical protein [Roseibacillus persicicus]